MKNSISQERLKEVLEYSSSTGVFTRIKRMGKKGKIGDIVGSAHGTGYETVCLDRGVYFLHRLAWFYMTGAWPENEIDHINGNRSDNRISNLRDVTRVVNAQNSKKAHKNNKSGFLGVSPNRDKFSASIRSSGKKIHLGTYRTPEEAHQVYLKSKRELHEGCTI